MTAPASLGSEQPTSFRLPRASLAGGFVAFFVSGGVVSLYGPAAPAFRRLFGVEAFTSGLPAAVHPFIALGGVLLWALLGRRLGPGRMLPFGVLALAGGAVGVALAPSMVAVLAWVLLIGLGFGLLSNAMNSIFPRDTSPRTPVTVGRMHGAFGIGAVLMPLVLASGTYVVAYLLVAALALVAVPLLARTPPAPEPPPTAATSTRAVRRSVLWFSLLFAGYVATESATGAWLATYLEGFGWSEASAARWTSAFWFVFTASRFAVAPLAQRVAPGRLVRWSLPAGAVAFLLATVPPLAPYGMVLGGLCIAPVFPSAMVWLVRAVPTARNATTAAMVAATAGATLGPVLVGGASTLFGGPSIPVTLAVIAGSAGLVARSLARRDPSEGASLAASPAGPGEVG